MTGRFVRTSNAFSAGFSYFRSIATGNAFISRMPPAISAELTNNCNLNCPECFSGTSQGLMKRCRGYMDTELFGRIITELRPFLYNINLYFQGEPMLHPKLFVFIQKSRGIRSVVSTNGHFLSPENAERLVKSGLWTLIVSLDGMDQTTYSSYRVNGDLQKVTEGIRNIAEARERFSSKMNLQIQFLVNRLNEHQIPLAKAFAHKMKASLRLKSMQIITKEAAGYWMPSKPEFCRYEKKNGEYVLKNSFPNRCPRLWFNPVITWDGKVLPCCFDKDAEHVMGDLNEESFYDIWEGPKYKIFRKNLLSGRDMTEICRNCTSGISLRVKR
ncbi:MAG: SPASM domain-containing protein [Bacteroidales bacterium]|nr:SPASM domain-containing protein [Bacteroidales bacterium]